MRRPDGQFFIRKRIKCILAGSRCQLTYDPLRQNPRRRFCRMRQPVHQHRCCRLKVTYQCHFQTYNIVSELPEFVCRGGSCIIDPYGHYLTKPVWDKEIIIYAELDMNLTAACKMEHDAIGHYARPDVLELKVNEK